jgi:hypothetical protein
MSARLSIEELEKIFLMIEEVSADLMENTKQKEFCCPIILPIPTDKRFFRVALTIEKFNKTHHYTIFDIDQINEEEFIELYSPSDV